jgi:hypothetical protein
MARLINLDGFQLRVEAFVAAGSSPEVEKFLEAWQRADRGDRN